MRGARIGCSGWSYKDWKGCSTRPSARRCFELRHPGWFAAEVYGLLESRRLDARSRQRPPTRDQRSIAVAARRG